MSLFGVDKEQDARLDALESHIRAMSEAIHENQLDSIKLRLALIRMESLLGDKVDTSDVDPALTALNDELGVAREEYDRMSAAAAESWSALQADVSSAVTTLRASVEEAAERIEQQIGK